MEKQNWEILLWTDKYKEAVKSIYIQYNLTAK